MTKVNEYIADWVNVFTIPIALVMLAVLLPLCMLLGVVAEGIRWCAEK